MDDPLQIAVISPYAWPPAEDVGRHVLLEAGALAALGHRVTILAPSRDRAAIAEGRRRREALLEGSVHAVLPPPGAPPLAVAVGRVRQGGAGRALAAPIDLATGLEALLSAGVFDVVHLHEPLAPSPALGELGHAHGATAVTFHGTSQLAGVAFLRPLIDRALARVDLRVCLSRTAARALGEVLPGDYRVLPAAADPLLTASAAPVDEPAPGVLVVARDHDRAGVRFALRELRAAVPTLGTITVLGPREAPWRTRAAVPIALRPHVRVIADTGPEAQAGALAAAALVLVPSAADVDGPLARAALARGAVLVAARAPESEELLGAGRGVLLAPFSGGEWAAQVTALVGDPALRRRLGDAGRRDATDWASVARALEAGYRGALERPGRGREAGTILADLGVWLAPEVDPDALVEAAGARGLDAVALIALGPVEPAVEAARRAARGPVLVVPGQRILTSEGVLVGLFLTTGVAAGASLAESAERVHAQGGLVVAPHPDLPGSPTPDRLRRLGAAVDCHQLLTVAAAQADEHAIRLARRVGLLVVGGSDARRPAEVGGVALRLPRFHDAASLLAALPEAQPVRGRRRRPVSRGTAWPNRTEPNLDPSDPR